MPVQGRVPELGEIALRAEVEREVRAELEPEYEEKRAVAADRAYRALSIVIGLAVMVAICVGIPLVGLVLGCAVRLYHIAAGSP